VKETLGVICDLFYLFPTPTVYLVRVVVIRIGGDAQPFDFTVVAEVVDLDQLTGGTLLPVPLRCDLIPKRGQVGLLLIGQNVPITETLELRGQCVEEVEEQSFVFAAGHDGQTELFVVLVFLWYF
jgi:hypothetical protein